MESRNYLNIFEEAANRLTEKGSSGEQLEWTAGEVLDSVFLKSYKRSWANLGDDPLTAETRIFFSIWVNESTLRQGKIYYNIHAFKLRKLKGYRIESKKFAASFRKKLQPYEHKWENLSTDFGPLTLMEGWIGFDAEKIQEDILRLAGHFIEIENLVEQTLTEFKNTTADC